MFMVDKAGYLEFLQIGQSNFFLLKQFGLDLEKPNSHLLDMGSGYGRLVAGILVGIGGDFKGNYTGMDILRRHVAWCESSYHKFYPGRVNFIHMDVYNSRYNPMGAVKPVDYQIPAAQNTYSFVSLFSVFTHMHENEIFHYLNEFERVLRPGGKVVATIFLYNKERLNRVIETGYGSLEYNDHTRIKDREDPLFAIVFEESWFLNQIVTRSGLEVEKVLYGNALGDPLGKNERPYPHLFQDMLVLKKL